jgi:hypothetical protein
VTSERLSHGQRNARCLPPANRCSPKVVEVKIFYLRDLANAVEGFAEVADRKWPFESKYLVLAYSFFHAPRASIARVDNKVLLGRSVFVC